MATVTYRRAGTDKNIVGGSFTSDGSAQTLNLGFIPEYIKVINETDAVIWEKTRDMAAANAMKIDTAVATDTNSYILINTTGTTVGTITLHATLVGTSKAITFIAMA
jgi:hypothetical protein